MVIHPVLNVNPNDPRNVFGTRQKVRAALVQYGIACWVKACCTRAVVYWSEDGQVRQRTLKCSGVRFTEPVLPWR
jgi:hypothetical protein